MKTCTIKPQTIILPGFVTVELYESVTGRAVLDVTTGGKRHRVRFTAAGDVLSIFEIPLTPGGSGDTA